MKLKQLFQRPTSIVVSAVLLLAGVLPAVVPALSGGQVFAYGEVQSRSIQLSNSAGGATSDYNVTFNAQTAGVVAGIVVDICSNDPIIGDTCTAPSGFTWGASPTLQAQPTTTGQTGLTWSAASANTGRTLELTTTGTASGQVSAGGSINFTITGVTNPTAGNTTFYGRIFTFSTTGGPSAWVTASTTGTSTTGVVDAGGIAMSTTNSITVTAKVQEQITFCVYTAATCAGGGTNVSLGDTYGVLSSAGPYVDTTTHYDISTNAGSGAVIDFTGPTLTSGANTITAIGASPLSSSPGTDQFGICTYESTGTTITPATTYNGGGACNTTTQTAGTASSGGAGTATFAFNTTKTTSTYGDTLANVVAGTSATGVIAMLGNINITQPAGIYTTTLNFVATGTY